MRRKALSLIILMLLLSGVPTSSFSLKTAELDETGGIVAGETSGEEGFSLHPLLTPYLSSASRDPPVTEWEETYDFGSNDDAHFAAQTNDGGYIIAGDSYFASKSDVWLVKTNRSGDMQWQRKHNEGGSWNHAHSVVEISDGSYIVAGATFMGGRDNDVWLLKTYADGTREWSKTYGGQNQDGAYSVRRTSNGGYIIAGATHSFGAGYIDFYLVNTNGSGDMQWHQTYGGPGAEIAYSVVQTLDGGYALCGSTSSFGDGGDDFWLVKVDLTGSVLWNKTYGGTGDDWARSMVQTSDGGYVLAGDTYSTGTGDADFWFVKTDFNGNMQWNNTYGETSNDSGFSVVQTSDGGYVGAGVFGGGNHDFWLIKLCGKGWNCWNSGWNFELGAFETGDLYDFDPYYEDAPWQGLGDYWGVRGYTWSQDESGLSPIHYCRFYSDGHAGYVYGWEEEGEWGVATYIQGDIWNSDPPWNCPEALPTHLKNLKIGIDLWRDFSTNYSYTDDRIMYAINVWFKSPELRNSVNPSYEKRLVMDLVFYVNGTVNEVKSYVDPDRYENGTANPDACYHYQAKIYTGENPTPYRSWKSWAIDLNEHIDEALYTNWKYWNETLVGPVENPEEVRRSLTLHQLEFILEVKHAWAGCAVDNFYLVYAFLGDVDNDGAVNLSDLTALGESYGSSSGLPNWNAYCDTNDDKVIDIYDLAIMGRNYGQD